ncbi:MAG: hypothetical protein QM736_15705 [Vicinamibacterales bacterium]
MPLTRGRCLAMALALLLGVAPSARAQRSPSAGPPTGTLIVSGDVATPLTLKVADLQSWPRKTVHIDEDGRAVAYEGVLVSELLKRAGAASGADLRGPAVAAYVVATGNDGYQAVYSVAELESDLHRQRDHRGGSRRGETALRLSGSAAAHRAEGHARRAVGPHAREGIELFRLKK